jgi:hypothetical protein
MSMSYIDLLELLPSHTVSNGVYVSSDGFILGQDFDGVFEPSNYYLRLVSEKLPTVTLKHKSSWPFTLARGFGSQDVVEASFIVDETLCVVKNPDGFVLGLAQKSGGKYLHVFDIGHYLRREKSYY